MSALNELVLYRRLAEKASNDPAVTRLLVTVTECFDEAVQRTKTVLKHMPEYTLHDEVHLLGVVRLMGRIIPERTLSRLEPLELAGLLLSAAYHDIGMAPSDDEVRALISAEPDSTNEERQQYLALREAYPGLLKRQASLRQAGRYFEAQEIEAGLLAEHLRRTHAGRARRVLFDHYEKKLVYGNHNFAAQLADVCISHNEDPSSLRRIRAHELVRAGGEYCNWQFVGCVLRLADILDFDPKRTPTVLFEHLGIRDAVSIKEWKKHRAITAWDIKPGLIAFAAQCSDPVIEKCVRDFIRLIERELREVSAVLAAMHDPMVSDLSAQYSLDLPLKVSAEDIRPEVGPTGPRYTYLDIGFSLDEDRIISLLMGLNLYRTPILFLRELLQNAVDACRHRVALHLRQPELGSYEPFVRVRCRQQDGCWFIDVEDNGMGMDDAIVRNYFARVGRSYYTSSDFLQHRARTGLDFRPVSQFGIGILSVFMVGDLLEVDTRRLSESASPLAIQVASQGSLFWFNKGARVSPGTGVSVRLLANPEVLWHKLSMGSEPTLSSTVATLAPHTHVPIQIIENNAEGAWLSESWTIQRGNMRHEHCSHIDVALNPAAGIEGMVRIHFLSGFRKKIRIEEEFDEYDEDLSDYLQHKWSFIERVHTDRSVKGGINHGYSEHLSSSGRWSQHGFAVRHALFPSGSGWTRRSEPPAVPFPLPVTYDINILPPLALPLTADRNGVVLSAEASHICGLIAEHVALEFFKALGERKIRKHRSFFEGISAGEGEYPEPFLRALRAILGE